MLFVLAALTFAACTHVENEFSLNRSEPTQTFTVGFENDATRIQLNDAGKSVWNKGDAVSVFHKSEENLKAIFQGKDGDRSGIIKTEKEATEVEISDKTVIVYPYNAEYDYDVTISTLKATLPTTLSYLKGSYAVGENLMVALGNSDSAFTLKSVCGWLKIQLTGSGEKVKNLVIRGNDGEQISGAISIDVEDLGVTLGDSSMAAKELFLDCNYTATLSAEATEFYVALPPQTFKKGITVEVNCKGYEPMTISTNNELKIERNHILPMASKEFSADKDANDNSSFLPEDINPTGTVFPHRVLLVDHTGTWCGNCPRVMDGLDALRATEAATYYHEVAVHGSSTYDKAYSSAASTANDFYYPNGYPDIRFNFYAGSGNNGSVAEFVSSNTSIINSLIKRGGADAGIAATAISGNGVVNTYIGVKAAVAQEYKVTAWLLENNISNPGQEGATQSSHYISNHSLRYIAGAYNRRDLSGDSLGEIAVGDIATKEYSIPLEQGWVMKNMDVLVIVSAKNASGKFEVANVALCPIDTSIDYYGNKWDLNGSLPSDTLATPMLSISEQSDTSFTVRWTAVANAEHYAVEFNGNTYTTTNTYMTFTDLSSGRYKVAVTAIAAKNSTYSDSSAATISIDIVSETPDVVYEAKKLNGEYYGWNSGVYKYFIILSTQGMTGFASEKQPDIYYRFELYSNTSSSSNAPKLPVGEYEVGISALAGTINAGSSYRIELPANGGRIENTPVSGKITVTESGIDVMMRFNDGKLHHVTYSGNLELGYEPIN